MLSAATLQAWTKAAPVLLVTALYIGLSICMITFNKFLMTEERFPFSVALVLLHMVGSFTLCMLLYLVKPTWFPAYQKMDGSATRAYMTYLVPVAFAFAGSLALSNEAYLYCSVAFLQMMKESNVAWVYLAGCIAGIEKGFEFRTGGLVTFIILATMITVHGEIKFVWLGVLVQLGSQLCEVMKITLQNLALTKSHEATTKDGEGTSLVAGEKKTIPKMDPLSFVLLIAPLVSIVLSAHLYFFSWEPRIWSRAMENAGYLGANVTVAFLLNVVISTFIAMASGLSFIVAGVAKDILIVVAGVTFFGEVLALQQKFGFALQIAGVFLYSSQRGFPHLFPKDQWLLPCVWRLVTGAFLGDRKGGRPLDEDASSDAGEQDVSLVNYKAANSQSGETSTGGEGSDATSVSSRPVPPSRIARPVTTV